MDFLGFDLTQSHKKNVPYIPPQSSSMSFYLSVLFGSETSEFGERKCTSFFFGSLKQFLLNNRLFANINLKLPANKVKSVLPPCSAFIGHSFTSCTRRICSRDYVVKEALAKFVWAVAVAIFARLLKRWTDKGRQKKGALMLSVIPFVAPISPFTACFLILPLHFCMFVGRVISGLQ